MDDFIKIILKILIFTIAMILTSLLGGKLHAPRGIMVFVFLIYVLEIVRSICWGILYSFDVLGAEESHVFFMRKLLSALAAFRWVPVDLLLIDMLIRIPKRRTGHSLSGTKRA